MLEHREPAALPEVGHLHRERAGGYEPKYYPECDLISSNFLTEALTPNAEVGRQWAGFPILEPRHCLPSVLCPTWEARRRQSTVLTNSKSERAISMADR